MSIRCVHCGVEREQGEFYKDKNKPSGYRHRCKVCDTESYAKWYSANKARLGELRAIRNGGRKRRPNGRGFSPREYNRLLRLEALKVYGGSCACCGETEPAFLALDHIGGGGNKHRRELGGSGSRLDTWLRSRNYPPGFQVLCHNCNMATSRGRTCPHVKVRLSLLSAA